MTTTFSVNQLLPLANRVKVNFEVMKKTIAQNSVDGSELSIFPEDFLYGVLRERSGLINAGKQFDGWVERFCKLAKQYDIAIIPGTFPFIRDGRIYNSTVYINKAGKVLASYSKNNLWLSERDEYTPALQLPAVFDSVLGKTAIIICWDIFDHLLFESAVKQGAEWIIIVAFWSSNQCDDLGVKRGLVKTCYGSIDPKMLDSLIQSRVAEYNVGIVFCNFAGKHEYIGGSGLQSAISANRSQVVAPYLQVKCRLSNRKEATLTCRLDGITQSIEDFEIHYGRRFDIVGSYPWKSQ